MKLVSTHETSQYAVISLSLVYSLETILVCHFAVIICMRGLVQLGDLIFKVDSKPLQTCKPEAGMEPANC